MLRMVEIESISSFIGGGVKPLQCREASLKFTQVLEILSRRIKESSEKVVRKNGEV